MPQAPRILSSSSINGDKVVNPQGDDLGKVEDLMIDLNTGKVQYAVLSFGGFLGLGDKYFAVPMEALQAKADAHEFVLATSEEKLKQAPGFDKDKWPNFADPSFDATVRPHYI